MRKSLIITAMAAMAISVSAAKVKKTVVPAEHADMDRMARPAGK